MQVKEVQRLIGMAKISQAVFEGMEVRSVDGFQVDFFLTALAKKMESQSPSMMGKI